MKRGIYRKKQKAMPQAHGAFAHSVTNSEDTGHVAEPPAALSAQLPAHAALALIMAVKKGLPYHEFEGLQTQLQLPADALAMQLGIARVTLHRRKVAGRLSAAESDKVVRFSRIFHQAAATLGGAEDARVWLSAPQIGLGGATPLAYAATEVGAREVEDLLGRVEHGVYA